MALSTSILVAITILVVGGHALRNDDFIPIGTINGKTFLVPVDNTTMIAYEAEAVCLKAGLESAIIRDDSEFRFVRQNVDPTSKFWVGAEIQGQREVLARLAFKWHDGTTMGSNVNFVHEGPTWLCVMLNVGRDVMSTELCLQGRYNALCQTQAAAAS